MLDARDATSDEYQRAQNARSPSSFLTQEQFDSLKGKLAALLIDGDDKGTIIATAPLDQNDPSKPRLAIQEQIATSAFNGRRYQLLQVLDTSAAGTL